MASFRNRCGECSYATDWGAESASTDAMLEHYSRAHPDVFPGGVVEFRTGRARREGPGFLTIVGVVVLICLFLAALRDCR
ncbi:hypothetical protein Afil01_29470 [Actinorhabdospora filicis]|uniref:Uncharacterized protein n=1 Tax=Actinorhabdospora filicis TaxID=1785913 RepID=A0A9W6WAY1_9ACTN|nr:hypothetical protein [Actinorhabdospora filicis]GLZ78140.1 hypothetical protein Afil01_29470 [Actinorhabdospora filicis]